MMTTVMMTMLIMFVIFCSKMLKFVYAIISR